MGRRVEDAVWDERRDLLQRQASSGISAVRFCRDNGLKLSNFHSWKRKLNGGTAGDWRMHSDGKIGPVDPRSGSFVQVPIRAVPGVSSYASWIEVSSAAGIVVRVPAGNLPALQMVLEAIPREASNA